MRKFLALVLALVMTMSLVTVSAGAATDFTDDAKIVNTEAVEVLNAIGILGGYADGSFRPQATLTRGAGAKLVAYLMLGQEAADKLQATYTVFEDVTDGVGLAPYIEWAAANGIVGGYGDGNFGPYDTLTQYAFGKMLLTAIGFESREQGYTGAGWQKNVYRDAVAKDIFDGSETYGACTRDDAARMTLATLETTYVVYGQALVDGSYNINGVWYNGIADVWVDGVHDTTLPVWATYEDLIFNATANDKWGNLGDRWIYDDVEIGFYEDETVATYTTQVDYCDLLVDLGISVNSNAKADLAFAFNGDVTETAASAWGVNYFDQYDYDVDTAINVVADLGHEDLHNLCDQHFVGGQGVLTKVFAIDNAENDKEKNYLVTEVATYLGEAAAPVKAHNAAYSTTFAVDYRDLTQFGFAAATLDADAADTRDLHTYVTASAENVSTLTDAYAKGEYALLTLELDDDGELAIDSHELAVGTAAVLNSYVTDKQASPKVGTTNKTADAFGFATGYDLVKVVAGLGETFVFYYDTYGNVIGAVEPEAATVYGVIDSIYSDHAAGVNTVTADVVALNASITDDVNVAKFNGVKAAAVDTTNDVDAKWNGTAVNEIAAKNEDEVNNDGITGHLFTYSVAANGDYTLQYVAEGVAAGEKTTYNDVVRAVAADELKDGSDTVIELTAKTQFLLRDVNGNYTAVTGYNNLPILTAEYAEVIFDETYTTEAAIVYLHNVAFDGAKVLGYIANGSEYGAEYYNNTKYYVYTMYVDGAERSVYVNADNTVIVDTIVNSVDELFEVQFNAVDGLLAVNSIVKQLNDSSTTVNFAADVIDYPNNNSAETLKIGFTTLGDDLALNNVEVYVVDQGDYTVEVGDFTALVDGANVKVVTNKTTGALLEIYVLLAD